MTWEPRNDGHPAKPIPSGWYPKWGKRTLDLFLGGTALAFTLPIQGLVALLVWRQLGRPILFRQPRPGKDEVPFVMVKFRTMANLNDSHGRPLPDEQRMTRIGSMLRATSLDELPELWHVVRGEMSLVGPRPLLEKYLPLYTSRQQHRHDVRPGIAGLAQCQGRNELPWHDKLELDVRYAEDVTLALDLRILARTCTAVITRRGINEPGSVTASEFLGGSS